MTSFVASALLALTLLNLWIGRSIVYPPALFTAVWSATLFGISASGSVLFSLSHECLLVFLAGGVAFSVGGAVAMLTTIRREGRAPPYVRPRRVRERLIFWGLVLTMAAIPLRVFRLTSLVDAELSDLLSTSFWIRVRFESIAETEAYRGGWQALTDNIVLFALFLALAGVAEDLEERRFRLRTAFLVVVALAYQLSTASRGSAATLVFGIVALAVLVSGRVSWRWLLLGIVFLLLTFSVVAVVLGKGGSIDQSIEENVKGVAEIAQLYALGAPIAFDHTLQMPADVPPVWFPSRIFIHIANKLGAKIALPSMHAEWTQVGLDAWTNAYTIYFAYVPSFGVMGAIGMLFALGTTLTWLFKSAYSGNPRSRLVFATMAQAIVMSVFAEGFFIGATFFAKAALFSLVFYGWRSPRLASKRGILTLPAKEVSGWA